MNKKRIVKALFVTLIFVICGGLPWAAIRLEKGVFPKDKQKEKVQAKFGETPVIAANNAWTDIRTVHKDKRCYTRYIWVRDEDTETFKVLSLVLNYISRGEFVVRPEVINSVARIDFNWYTASDEDLKDWIQTWEELAFDPSFNRFITKDNIDFGILAQTVENKTIIVNHQGGEYVYPDDSGRRHANLSRGLYTVDLEFHRNVGSVKEQKADVERYPSRILPSTWYSLQDETHSQAPVVEAQYFINRAMTTIKNNFGVKDKESVFKKVFGGLYYEFKGVKTSKDPKVTDLDLYFQALGIDKQEALFDRLRSDQRVAMEFSRVTGKPREVLAFHVPADRQGVAWGSITGDIKDADIDIGDHPMANLLKPRRQAREAIFPGRTSFPVFAVFDGQGKRVDEVPPDVAKDNTIPHPFPDRLQPAIGCLRCHGPDSGLKPVVNDVKLITASNRLDIFGDLSQGKKAFDVSTIKRLQGLYQGDFNQQLRLSRDVLANISLKATGPWKESTDQTDAAVLGAAKTARIFADYNYTLVDPKQALFEMGVIVPKDTATAVFNRLVAQKPVPGADFDLEDPRIGQLREGKSILRRNWALIYTPVMERYLK